VQSVALTSGPLPPPEQLAQYEQIIPGAANRILTLAERQTNHRMEIISAQIRQSARGQWLAFILALCFLAGSIWVTLAGSQVVGGILGGATILGVVTIFITGKAQQKPASNQTPVVPVELRH
jgi:uncharacterized membrane protein